MSKNDTDALPDMTDKEGAGTYRPPELNLDLSDVPSWDGRIILKNSKVNSGCALKTQSPG